MDNISTPEKPGEVICFFPVEFPVQEGNVYFFLGMDVASRYAFQTGLEKSNDIEHVLKHIQLLMEDEEFKKRSAESFTLVLHKHKEHKDKIEEIIKPHGGSFAVNDPYLTEQLAPLIKDLFVYLAGNKEQ